jgi:hypothetical protein
MFTTPVPTLISKDTTMTERNNYLRCLSDDMTPVRDATGRLLGAIPRVADTAEAVRGADGTIFELRYSIQTAVCVAPEQNPASLSGYVPLRAAAEGRGEQERDPNPSPPEHFRGVG